MTVSIRTPDEAVEAAKATHTNIPDACQQTTREWLNAPSAGDQDGDGDADAVDGWESEPVHARHRGDRNPPKGFPVAWSGGSEGHGHRALSLGADEHGNVWIRSTDAGGRGVTATVPLSWPEKTWGLVYTGWSETIDGYPIPPNPVPKPTKKPKPKGDHENHMANARAELKQVEANSHGARKQKAENALDDISKKPSK